ncbi:MAG: DUF2911 domain-containing protein [Bacteroidota bacterium]|nr:DUF2911 domain-containing protein [Bacteroidota bacterium]
MKKLGLLILFVGLFAPLTKAQIITPAPSPAAKVEQRIGLTDVVVEYSRPAKKGRAIYGGLVPYHEVWRTGANAATKITFSENVTFGGAAVAKGSYALMTKPSEKSWEFMLYPHNNTSWSSYMESDVKPITGTVQVYIMPKGVEVESLMMGFDEITYSSGEFYVLWDNVYVPFEIKVNTDETVEASIAKVMAGPSSGDYYSAANYYLNAGKDLNKSLEWIDKSIDMGNDKFWVLRTKSLIQAGLGDKKGATITANRSLEMAKEAKNADYIKMNEDSIAEWKKS